jgi:hypothetical protein
MMPSAPQPLAHDDPPAIPTASRILDAAPGTDDDILRWLLRYPLLRGEDLAVLAGCSRSWIAARLGGLRRQDLVEVVHAVQAPTRGGRNAALYALSASGLERLVAAFGPSVWAAARRWHADADGLLRLIPRAPALVAVQSFVLALLRDAPAALSRMPHGAGLDATNAPAADAGDPWAHRPDQARHVIRRDAIGRIEWGWTRDHVQRFVGRSRSGQLRFDAYVRLTLVPKDGAAAEAGRQGEGDGGRHVGEVAGALDALQVQQRVAYGCFILHDGGWADEHLLLQQLRMLLRCRETFEETLPGGVFPALLVLTSDAHRADRWQALALRLATERWLTHPLHGGVLVPASASPTRPATALSTMPSMPPMPPMLSPWWADWLSLAQPASRSLITLLVPTSSTRCLPEMRSTRSMPSARSAAQSASGMVRAASAPLPNAGCGPAHPPVQCTSVRQPGVVSRRARGNHSEHLEYLEQLARAARTLGPRELAAMRLLYAHPLLAADDLAAFLGITPDSARRYLRTPLQLALISADANRMLLVMSEAPEAWKNGSHASGAQGQARYALTPAGLALLTAGVGLPSMAEQVRFAPARTDGHGRQRVSRLLARYAREVAMLTRTPEHTAGIYTFFAQLHRAAQLEHAAGCECVVTCWETGSACARQYREADGWHAIRPDGACEVIAAGRRLRFWLEWDRGTMSRRDLRAKFAAYTHYVRSHEWHTDGNAPLPMLLVVTPDVGQETRIAQELRAAVSTRATLAIRVALVADLNRYGPLAPIWKPYLPPSPATRLALGEPRVHWPLSESETLFPRVAVGSGAILEA